MSDRVFPGQSYPLGATVYPDGVNFSVYSKRGTAVDLLFFDAADDHQPSQVIHLDSSQHHRTDHYWHAFVRDIQPGQIYGFRVFGAFQPEEGLTFDAEKILLDPYGKAVAGTQHYRRRSAEQPGDNTPHAMKSVVADMGSYDWEGDEPLYLPSSKTIIYEMHVGGFTRHASSGIHETQRGTYRGLIEKIPYLKDLGVTAVELLPVFQFDEQEAMGGLTNYWGYNPVSFFAPHCGYASDPGNPLSVLDEFRDMVKALHQSGIEVILDVVFNHTAEGNEQGPTLCFKGFENITYYILSQDRKHYHNYSGTGNTLNANHSVVRRLILDSLRYWVTEMHVDGFRFDLASVLARDTTGKPLAKPPILWDIETDPVLSGTKLIAEAWDAAGLYQVGNFFGDHWKEWNGRFRDDVRAFVKSDPGYSGKLASRFLASPDMYLHKNQSAEQSINFVTCHDGFTLNDLVSYDQKHNLANNEDNRDGHNHNLSWNCGVEGPTDDPEIERLRKKQIKNFLTINLLSLGIPMILMGDEIRRTQQGNNNAYCQDNDISWMDWSRLEQHRDIYRFAQKLIRFRLNLPVRDEELTLSDLLKQTKVEWHGVHLYSPDWSGGARTLAFTLQGQRNRFHIMFNAFWLPLKFDLPRRDGSTWKRLIDTSLASPDDFCDTQSACALTEDHYMVEGRSSVVVISDLTA